MLIMENMKINIDDYEEFGLGDLYYTLIPFIADYARKYDSFENFETILKLNKG